jgi:hypothetical protein
LKIPPTDIKNHHKSKDDPDSSIPHLGNNEASYKKEYKCKYNVSREVLVPHYLVAEELMICVLSCRIYLIIESLKKYPTTAMGMNNLITYLQIPFLTGIASYSK